MRKVIDFKREAGAVLRAFTQGSLRAYLLAVVLTVFAAPTLAATFVVNNFNDSGAGSLRQAILDANAMANSPTTTPDLIQVSNGTGTINLVTALPTITDAVRIINFDTGQGRVELNGLATQSGAAPSIGLDIEAANCATSTPACEIWGFAINRFGAAGIVIGPGADGTIVHQNYIGTDITGTLINCPDAAHPCGNINRGVWVNGAANVQIGVGTFAGHSNTISGNFGRGIVVSNATIGLNTIAGSAIIKNNYIGTTGTFPTSNVNLGNTGDGIMIAATSNNVIGGVNPNDRNYILANGFNGIEIIADKTNSVNTPASNNLIQGNYIGQTASTISSIGNKGSGIVIRGSGNTVGGTVPEARNIIVGNAVAGIAISGSLATGNVVQGNYIGVASDGTTSFANLIAGVQISDRASNNTIGGAATTPGQCNGPCNIIANNGDATTQSAKAGLYLDPTSGTGNAIRGNSIFNNGGASGLGIDLGTPGSNAANAGASTGSANDLQNRPVISTANTSGFISGTLNGAASTTFVIDLYLNLSTDTLAASEARTYLGSVNTTTSAGGSATFNKTVSVTMATGQFVTATATRSIAPLNTSEISDAQAVVTQPTAAGVSVSGQIMTKDGRGIRNVRVMLTDSAGVTRNVISGPFGYFQFDDVPTGQSYVLSAQAKQYRFGTSLIHVDDNMSDIVLTGEPQ